MSEFKLDIKEEGDVVIITTEGIGNAYDRLLFTNAVNNSEVNKIDTRFIEKIINIS